VRQRLEHERVGFERVGFALPIRRVGNVRLIDGWRALAPPAEHSKTSGNVFQRARVLSPRTRQM